MKTIFLGTPWFAAQILQALAASSYRPVLAISEPAKPVGRTQQLTDPPVIETARTLGIATAQPANHEELLTTVKTAEPDLGIVVAYGRILKPELLEIPTFGFVNIHYSLLPKYRGASPVQTALLADETETGVTIMQIDAGLDTGPILAQITEPIQETDTTATLLARLSERAVPLLVKTLDQLASGTLVAQPQPAASPTPVTRRLTKVAGRLAGTESPVQVLRMLRAYTPWPGVWFELDGQRIILKAAHLEADLLIPDQIQLSGKQAVRWVDVRRDRPVLVKQIDEFLNTA